MKIGILGDGTLDPASDSRDGSKGERRALVAGLAELGVDVVYMTLRRRAGGGDLRHHLRDWAWRDKFDAVMIEVRRPVFKKPKHEHAVYWQARLLLDWADSELGKDCKLFLADFDLNVKPVFGFGRRGHAELCKPAGFFELTPEELAQAVDRAAAEAIVLTNCEPSLTPLVRQRRPGHTYQVRRWLWPYPAEFEAEPLPWSERHWDLAYAGSDYNRREKFWRYYVEGAKAGARVAVAGAWGNQRVGGLMGESEAWSGKGFRSRVKAAAPNLTFMCDGPNKLLPYTEAQRVVRHAKAVVQIVPPDCEWLGMSTIRIAEAACAGAIPFVDRDIKAHEAIVPHDWFRVSSYNEVAEKMQSIAGQELEYVRWWRKHLRGLGTGRERAAELLAMINE
jgi:hypothetical protein